MLATIGMLSYSNTYPLGMALAQDRDLILHYDTPNHLYSALKAKELDVALTSSLHMRDPDLIPLSDYGIAAHKEVQSVILYHNGPLTSLEGKEIAISSETTTSFALLRILCQKLWHICPRFTLLSSSQKIDPFPAALLIGDEALKEKKGFQRQDLATAWYELTKLPFVFARFFIHNTSASLMAEITEKLEASLPSSPRALPHLAQEVAIKKNIPFPLVQNYYQLLNYVLGPEEKRGLNEFIKLADDCNL